MLRVFCELAGIGYEEARGVGEDRRYATLGFLTVLVAAMATFSTAATTSSQLHLPWRVAVPVSVLIGLIVYGIDRYFVLTPILKDTFGYRARILGIRGIVSVFLGLYISHGLVMYAYNDTLQHRADRAAERAAIGAATRAKGNASEAKDITDLTNANQALQAAITDAQTLSDTKKRAWKRNTACVNGTRLAADGDYCGSGGASPDLKQDWIDYRDGTLKTTLHNNTAQIARNNKTIDEDRATLKQKIESARSSELENNGFAARNSQLPGLLADDPFLLLLPLVLLVLDLSVVLAKATFPVSRLDLQAQFAHRQQLALSETMRSSAAVKKALEQIAELEAARMLREATFRDARAAAREEKLTKLYVAKQTRRDRLNRRLLAWIAGGTVAALVIVAGAAAVSLRHHGGQHAAAHTRSAPSAVPSGDGKRRIAPAADRDRSLRLSDDVVLDLPRGSISNNAEVTATPAVAGSMPTWSGHDAVTPAFRINTAGRVIGRGSTAPHLILSVPQGLRSSADAGTLSVAFHGTNGWTDVTGSYDRGNSTYSIAMPHFSWWQFWDWDWPTIGANISQTLLSLIQLRSTATPKCDGTAPAWFRSAPGVAADAGLVIRSCTQESSQHPGVLDVEIVNNRPFGMILSYGGAHVQWGWHQDPDTIAQAIQYALGDAAADASGGLYLPPLARASVGIFSPGPNASHGYFIGPTYATLAADFIGIAGGAGFSSAVGAADKAATYKLFRNEFLAKMGSSCGKMNYKLARSTFNGDPLGALNDLVGGDLAQCVADVAVNLGRDALAAGTDLASLNKFSEFIGKARDFARKGLLAQLGIAAGEIADLYVDYRVALGDQGYGFTVWAKGTDQPAPVSSSPASLAPTTAPHTPMPPTTSAPASVQTSSGPGPSLSSPPTTTPSQVRLYDNYGTVATPGTPMCVGNPNRPESLPGGSLVQSFSVPVQSTLTSAVVQIDHSDAITVTATVVINGVSAVSAPATPTDDTTFTFAPTAIPAGATVGLQLTWTGTRTATTNPKLDTIYTVGSTAGSLSVNNACPDGAPSYQTSSAGLRAIVYGTR